MRFDKPEISAKFGSQMAILKNERETMGIKQCEGNEKQMYESVRNGRLKTKFLTEQTADLPVVLIDCVL